MKSPARVSCFAPVANSNAKILILGSMPGQASLDAQQYYAHPRNAFWPILCIFLQIPLTTAYTQKLQALKSAHIALWDVLADCERKSSLDSHIQHDSLQTNDFINFFATHKKIHTVLLNGSTADQLFRKRVFPELNHPLQLYKMPSTSPAHASLNLDEKKLRWTNALRQALSS
jgi:TDG/mug DNA glycosylase family protein